MQDSILAIKWYGMAHLDHILPIAMCVFPTYTESLHFPCRKQSVKRRLNDKQRRDAFNHHGNPFYAKEGGRILVIDQHKYGKYDCRNGKADRDKKELCTIMTKGVRLHKQQDCAVNKRDGKHDVHWLRKIIRVYNELEPDCKTHQSGKQHQRVLIAVMKDIIE